MTRRFNKFGLRRDQNFSDIVDPERALNSLLDGLVEDTENESFISADLDVIRDISDTTITKEDLNRAAAAAYLVNDDNGNLVVYKPILKLKNRIDNIAFTTGDPTFFGGDGLTNRIYNGSQINSTAVNPANIFTNPEQSKLIYWERGLFNYGTKFLPSFDNGFGGVEWNGFFVPTESGNWEFYIQTSGFFTLEFADQNGDYQLIKRKSKINDSFGIQPAGAGSSIIALTTPSNSINILVGDAIINAGIPQFATGNVTVTAVNADGSITISEPLINEIASATNFTFRFAIGVRKVISQTPPEIIFPVNDVIAYNKYVIRMKFWIPQIPETAVGIISRTFNMYYRSPTSTTNNLVSTFLYSEDYPFDSIVPGDFKVFYGDRINAGGGTIGGPNIQTYQRLLTTRPFNVTYSPPQSYTSIVRRVRTTSTIIEKNAIPISLTDNIEVGNYVFGDGIPQGTRVIDLGINTSVFLSNPATATIADIPVTFIDHRGLIAFDSTTSYASNGHTLTGVDPSVISLLSVGDIIVNPHTSNFNIITLISGTTITGSKPFTGGGTGVITYFYKSNGLYNEGLKTYCLGTLGVITGADNTTARNKLFLVDLTGITLGMVVQFGSIIPAGTTVTSINTGEKSVTLSVNTSEIVQPKQLITFAPSGTTDSKEVCFTPLDISPPFVATPQGMATLTTRPSIVIAPTVGQGELRFGNLIANNVTVPNSIAVQPLATPNAAYTLGVLIKDVTGRSYNILAIPG